MTQNTSHTQRELFTVSDLLFFMSNRARFPKGLRQAIKHRWALILFMVKQSLGSLQHRSVFGKTRHQPGRISQVTRVRVM